MQVIKLNPDSPDEKTIKFAAELIKNGGLVAFPTETVYGIGANFLDEKALGKLYAVKKRPGNKPFTVHIAAIKTIEGLGCEITPSAGKLIGEFWPGSLTVILPGKSGKIGFRMPSNTIARMLISESGVPVAAPSANISGKKPATRAEEIEKAFKGKIDLVLDAGETEVGRESTVVDASVFPVKILREGAISVRDIEKHA